MNASESCKVAAAKVLGRKTARACDNCLLKRARWFCAADDAFLCQGCDTTVHSANQLAGRHHRVRLQTASFKGGDEELGSSSWHQGFTRKARTQRRPAKSVLAVSHSMVLVVPEINGEENYFLPEEKEEQLFHTVPDSDLDPFVNEFMEEGIEHELDVVKFFNACDEFGDSLGSEEVKILDADRVKVEDEKEDGKQAVIAGQFDEKLETEMNWELDDYSCYIVGEEGDEAKRVGAIEENNTWNMDSDQSGSQVKERMFLKLNYEQVLDAWASQGCPWENGLRPDFDLDVFMAECVGGDSHWHEGSTRRDGAEREARVLRYREKRRTRLFSKKIRYQVRKLNAEKRPRMKGRFVKGANFSGSSLSFTITDR